jgi:hypothetical protein
MTTRGLDYRFLWVNALCIIQPKASGDSTDWEIEGPRMGLIYQNVVCTIAATCAENADEGFLSTVGSGSLNIMPCTITDRRQGARHIQPTMVHRQCHTEQSPLGKYTHSTTI